MIQAPIMVSTMAETRLLIVWLVVVSGRVPVLVLITSVKSK